MKKVCRTCRWRRNKTTTTEKNHNNKACNFLNKRIRGSGKYIGGKLSTIHIAYRPSRLSAIGGLGSRGWNQWGSISRGQSNWKTQKRPCRCLSYNLSTVKRYEKKSNRRVKWFHLPERDVDHCHGTTSQYVVSIYRTAAWEPFQSRARVHARKRQLYSGEAETQTKFTFPTNRESDPNLFSSNIGLRINWWATSCKDGSVRKKGKKQQHNWKAER